MGANSTPNASEDNTPRGLIGADDSLAYVKKKKAVVIDKSPNQEEPTEAQEESAEALSHEEHTKKYQKMDWKKRYDELKRHHDRKLNGMKEELENLKQARPKFQPPKTPEDLAKFRADNPDIYDVVETVAHMRASDETEQLKSTVSRLTQELESQAQARAVAELKMLAPDFAEISKSEDFKYWASEQPEEIQRWIFDNPNNAQLAAKAINLYKADRGVQSRPHSTAQRTSAADAVSTSKAVSDPSTRGDKPVFTTTQLSQMSWQEYDKRRDEIDQAHREGRVVRG